MHLKNDLEEKTLAITKRSEASQRWKIPSDSSVTVDDLVAGRKDEGKKLRRDRPFRRLAFVEASWTPLTHQNILPCIIPSREKVMVILMRAKKRRADLSFAFRRGVDG